MDFDAIIKLIMQLIEAYQKAQGGGDTPPVPELPAG